MTNEMFFITDESGRYVHEDSIRIIDKNICTYTSHERVERLYTADRINEVLKTLVKLNNVAKMNHTFKVDFQSSKPEISFGIIDDKGNYVDTGSFNIWQEEKDSKSWEWIYHSHTTTVNSVYRYSFKDKAEKIIEGLGKIAELMGIDVKFSIKEFDEDELLKRDTSPAEMICTYKSIPRGQVTINKNRLKEIRMRYAM